MNKPFAERTGYVPYRYERPPFGEFGAVQMEGDKMVCHICGRAFVLLGQHTRQAHDLRADDYRELFELKRGQPLASGSWLRRHIEVGSRAEFVGILRRARESLTPEQLEANRHKATEAAKHPRRQWVRELGVRNPQKGRPLSESQRRAISAARKREHEARTPDERRASMDRIRPAWTSEQRAKVSRALKRKYAEGWRS